MSNHCDLALAQFSVSQLVGSERGECDQASRPTSTIAAGRQRNPIVPDACQCRRQVSKGKMARDTLEATPESIAADLAPRIVEGSGDVASHDSNTALFVSGFSRASLGEIRAETPKSANDNPRSAPSPTCRDNAEESKPGNRKSRKREKQRARRALKRRQNQETTGVESASQDDVKGQDGGGTGKRHRPTQVEQSMNFFMTMYDWSGFFLRSESWLPHLNAGGKLDFETAESISRAVKRSWFGSGGPSGFKSLEELERFTELKEKEASYIEKQLNRMPSLQDEAWKSYFGDLERLSQQRPVEEILGGPAEFLRDTILPCLRAQVISLRARTREVRVLRDKYERLCQKWDRQEGLRSLISSLRISQGLIIPVCPVWKEVSEEIELLQGDLLEPHDLRILNENRRRTQVAYEEAMVSALLVA
ncbi:hypothetical protein B0T24DRAFT_627581 [Lasiosphaeria ovina]|uniref:Uncharacterized protein n=1 Tax=Lasiosphaeria ovina TaxID=92902 RepID=A0AAE0K7I1_9PEZI|nr:hypothetical protein B0T24DRAFT_627581 [Lasiosphaeria ovina]